MARLLHRLGSFCARRRLLVIAVWALLVIGIGATVSAVGAQTNNDLSLPGTDSQEAKDLLADRFPPQQNGVNPIVFDVDTGTLTDDDHRQAVTASVKAMREVPHVYSVTNPTSSSGQTAGLLAKDQQTAFAPVLLDIGSGDLTEAEAQRVLDATEPAQRAGITVAAGGSIGSTLSTEGTETSEVVGIVAAMVILSLVLGSLVAMGLPIVTAVVGLGVALSVVGLVGHAVGIPSSGPTLATMIGLGVGIDYALFLITRHQDNLRTGMPVVDSVAQTVATSGSAVVFAG
ncbi:MAG: MMPL family transporter, partial [Nocardioidaceae bacterium]|nr:MMPL family transporter [Nocardioidaceae bacterium]